MIAKRYLGDGVYATIEHGMIKLTAATSYGSDVPSLGEQTIYLEPDVLSALFKFHDDAQEAATNPPTEDRWQK